MNKISKRDAEIYRLRKSGHTYDEIGKRYGLSKTRCKTICDYIDRIKEYREEYGEMSNLSTRVCNGLRRGNIYYKKDLIEKLNSDGIFVRNIGKKGICELEQFVGFEIEIFDAVDPKYLSICKKIRRMHPEGVKE